MLFSKYIFLKFGLCIQDSEELTDINSRKQAEQNQILGSPELSKNALALYPSFIELIKDLLQNTSFDVKHLTFQDTT